ncbi:MAG: radical SAM protein [Candidatus Gracilibacteria bacterium]
MNRESFYGQNSSFRETGEESPLQSFALEMVSGTACQLKCEACYKKNGPVPEDHGKIPYEDAISYIDQAKKVGFKEIVLIGGEPTLHPDIFTLIEEIRLKGLKPILCTNGIIFANPSNAEKLEGSAVTVVTHANVPGQEEAIDKYSGLNGYSKILERGIKNLKKIPDATLVLEMPLTDSLYEHAFTFFRNCRQNNIIPFIEISRSTDKGLPTTNITPEQVAVLFKKFQEYDLQNFPHLADNFISPPAYGNKCTMSITGLHVKNFGEENYGGVYSCCAQGIKHGDLKEQTLEEIMRSPTLQVFMNQDEYIVGPCKDCNIYDLCKGGCRGEAFLKFGCPRASSPVCSLIPKSIREDKSKMAPLSCENCPAENCGNCNL